MRALSDPEKLKIAAEQRVVLTAAIGELQPEQARDHDLDVCASLVREARNILAKQHDRLTELEADRAEAGRRADAS